MAVTDKRTIEAALGQRVYEYQGTDGATYYSFTRNPNTISGPIRLRIKSRLGTHLVNFLVQLRRLGDILGVQDPGDEG